MINQGLNLKIIFYYLDVYDITFFILMINKRFIYFLNPIKRKNKNIFVILFYYFYFLFLF